MTVKLDRDIVENSSYKVVHDNTVFQGILYSESPIIPTMRVISTELRCNVIYPDGTPCSWALPLKTSLPIAFKEFGYHNTKDHGGLFIARLRYGHQIANPEESTLNDPKSGHARRGWSNKRP